MSLAHNNIALKDVAEGQWIMAVRDANLSIRANGRYGDFVSLMRRYADLSLGLADGESFSIEYLRQFFQIFADDTFAVLAAKFVSCLLLVYPIAGRRTLGCAYGGRCKLGKCVFCLPLPEQICSYPSDFVSLCTVFWDLKPAAHFPVGVGAMLAASHVRGHSCVTSLYANRMNRTAPHGVVSFEHLHHAVGEHAFDEFDDGSPILKVSVTSKGAGDSVHYLPCTFSSPQSFPEITVHSAKTTLMFEVLSLSALSSLDAIKSLPPADKGLGLSPPEFCRLSCGGLESDKAFCGECGFVVKQENHGARCSQVVPSMYSKTQARLGDVMHRFDVIVGLSARGIYGSDQTRLIADMVSAKEQMAFMVAKNYAESAEPQATVSTRFEQDYLTIRSSYLAYVFPNVPFEVFEYSFPKIHFPIRAVESDKSDPPIQSFWGWGQLRDLGSSSVPVGLRDSTSDSDVSGDAGESVRIGEETSAAIERKRSGIRYQIALLETAGSTERDMQLLADYRLDLKRLGKLYRSRKRAEAVVGK